MAKDPLHVLFLPKWYPSKFDEFDGNFIENHAIALHQHCRLGLIFVHSDASVSKSFKIEKTSPHGFPEWRVFYKKANSGIVWLDKIVGFYRYYKAQQIAYKAYEKEMGVPDLTHVHINGRSAILALGLKRKKNIPFLLSEHWSGYAMENGAFRGSLRKWIYRYIGKRSEHITCVSNYLKKAMQSHHIEGNYSIVPNVVNTKLFQPIEKQVGGRKRIVHISNLTKSPKNIHLIVEALHRVGLERDDFEVDIIGTGPEEEQMLKELKKSSIKDRFNFHGEIHISQVAKFLAKADFMLLYSQYETQSVVLIESFACGVPVLVPDVGGIPEYMSSERGVLLPPNSTEELVQGVHQLLDTFQQFDRQKMIEYARREFSEVSISKQFLTLYQQSLQHD